MTKKQLHEYGMLYYPYNKRADWVNWFVNVAPLKAERSVKILRQYKKSESKLLDYGCGIGFNIFYYSKAFKYVIGIDNDKTSIDTAKRQLKKLNCKQKVFHYNGKKLPFKDVSFDIVTANDVYEHADNPRLMLKEIRRVLKPDGILYIHNPNKLWPLETHYKLPFLSYLPAKWANLYVRITNRANRYDDIHLPTYGEFKKNMEVFFTIKNITFDLMEDYRNNKLDKERGSMVVIVGSFLRIIKPLKKAPVISVIYFLIIELLNRIATGWIFLAWPKKH